MNPMMAFYRRSEINIIENNNENKILEETKVNENSDFICNFEELNNNHNQDIIKFVKKMHHLNILYFPAIFVTNCTRILYHMKKQLQSTQRSQIVALLEQGMSTREVARKFAISQSIVVRTKEKYNKPNSFEHNKNNGRLSVLFSGVLSYIKNENSNNSKKSLRKIAINLKKEHEITISHVSVRNTVNSLNISVYSPIKKPLLIKRHIDLRYQFSETIIKMSIDKIKTIIFGDESKFILFRWTNISMERAKK